MSSDFVKGSFGGSYFGKTLYEIDPAAFGATFNTMYSSMVSSVRTPQYNNGSKPPSNLQKRPKSLFQQHQKSTEKQRISPSPVNSAEIQHQVTPRVKVITFSEISQQEEHLRATKQRTFFQDLTTRIKPITTSRMAYRQKNLSMLSPNAISPSKAPPTTAPNYEKSSLADYRYKKLSFKMPTGSENESRNIAAPSEVCSINS